MSTGAVATLDLAFGIESKHFSGLVNDIFAQQLNVGLPDIIISCAARTVSESPGLRSVHSMHLRKDDEVRRKLSPVAKKQSIFGEAFDGHKALHLDPPVGDQVGTTFVHP